MIRTPSECLEQLKKTRPLVHCITNMVTVNDCANALLAVGASPVMTDAYQETVEMTSLAHALYLNIGTPRDDSTASMFLSAESAHSAGKPVVLDPVGAGATRYRTDTVERLLATGNITLVRGNLSEIRTVAGLNGCTRGVDAAAEDNTPEEIEANHAMVRKLASGGFLVGVSGAVDRVSDSSRLALVRNGVPSMTAICGTGCILSALCAAFLGANDDTPFDATVAAFIMCGVAGEKAHQTLQPNEGLGSERVRFLDALGLITPEELETKARCEFL